MIILFTPFLIDYVIMEVHYWERSFWVMTRVRRPYLAKSEHAYVMKSESIEDIFGYITVSAPLR